MIGERSRNDDNSWEVTDNYAEVIDNSHQVTDNFVNLTDNSPEMIDKIKKATR